MTHLPGDKYQVHFQLFDSVGHTQSSNKGPFDSWQEAKAERNEIYFGRPSEVRNCWIMRSNPSMNMVPQRYGANMRRDRREGAAA